ncbi:hypothetical protein [Halobacillus karajensis]|uniref:Uncharacterized protein n=1 Tax=Halobacillus karajensis TaxID=195088 RepID=A0A024P4C5_9BACI|nr:hypothetical protein [Halobacillus karajensis]CDQ19972.1 hypothetical protein BN982_02279 [Halobacillus karajensis]CDQ22432.1 hypothetical protein BN983_00640 [Halobacillus karajensis]CDQ28275.1 hypothetical protein BN981_02569 [Halobacillus karajensis]
MNELSSYQITLKRPLKTIQIMKMYKIITKNGCDLYLLQNQLIADAGHLPKLLSFFLFMDVDDPFLMIIDGKCVDKVYQKIEAEWKEHIVESSCRRKYSKSVVESEISISV